MCRLDERGSFPRVNACYESLWPSKAGKSVRGSVYMSKPEIREAVEEGRRKVLAEMLSEVNELPIANKGWRVGQVQANYDLIADFLEKVQQVEGFDALEIAKAVVDSLRDLRSEAAKELGQLIERKDLTSGGQPIGIFGLSETELDDAIQSNRSKNGEASASLPA